MFGSPKPAKAFDFRLILLQPMGFLHRINAFVPEAVQSEFGYRYLEGSHITRPPLTANWPGESFGC